MNGEEIKSWKEINILKIKEAVLLENGIENLKKEYPNVQDWEELEKIKEKYGVEVVCPFCGTKVFLNYWCGIPTQIKCLECGHTIDTSIVLSPGFIADWLLKFYKFATTQDKDQNIFVYDETRGIWDDGIVDAVIKKELAVILTGKLTTQKFNNVKINLQAKTFVGRDKFSSAVKIENGEILINLKNGVLHYPSLKLTPHDPNYYFLSGLDIEFDPNAPVPEKFLTFLAQITLPNEENFINLLETFAYPLLPGYQIQRAVVLVGSGNNGKSTYLKILERFYGEKYISHLTMQQLSNAIEGQPFALIQLIGKLANVADDLPDKPVRYTGYFKQLTGGSSVEGERKFGNRVSFTNTAKFFFAANKMPVVSEDTIAFYRRFLFIEFANQIQNPRDQNEILEEICNENEKKGILKLLLLFVLPKLIKKNDFTFAKDVEEVEEQYQKHSNTAQLFSEKYLEFDPNSELSKEEIWKKYEEFCKAGGLVEVSQKLFWQTIKTKFPQIYEKQFQEMGIHKRIIVGLKIIENLNNEDENNDNIVSNQNILFTYFNQDNQDNQDFSSFLKNFEVLKCIKNIKENLGYVGYPVTETPTEFQNHETPPNTLTKVNISKEDVLLELVKQKKLHHMFNLKEINELVKDFGIQFEDYPELNKIIRGLMEKGAIWLNPTDGYFYLFKDNLK
ncbi:MAG: DNA primase family protein [Candidatus Micrarchaeia archaeon]